MTVVGVMWYDRTMYYRSVSDPSLIPIQFYQLCWSWTKTRCLCYISHPIFRLDRYIYIYINAIHNIYKGPGSWVWMVSQRCVGVNKHQDQPQWPKPGQRLNTLTRVYHTLLHSETVGSSHSTASEWRHTHPHRSLVWSSWSDVWWKLTSEFILL